MEEEPVTAPGPLVLAAASFSASGLVLVLTFDRAVDISGFDATQVAVSDGAGTQRVYTGSAASAMGPAVVLVTLAASVGIYGEGVQLLTTATTGIVAAADGALWAGANGLALPYA